MIGILTKNSLCIIILIWCVYMLVIPVCAYSNDKAQTKEQETRVRVIIDNPGAPLVREDTLGGVWGGRRKYDYPTSTNKYDDIIRELIREGELTRQSSALAENESITLDSTDSLTRILLSPGISISSDTQKNRTTQLVNELYRSYEFDMVLVPQPLSALSAGVDTYTIQHTPRYPPDKKVSWSFLFGTKSLEGVVDMARAVTDAYLIITDHAGKIYFKQDLYDSDSNLDILGLRDVQSLTQTDGKATSTLSFLSPGVPGTYRVRIVLTLDPAGFETGSEYYDTYRIQVLSPAQDIRVSQDARNTAGIVKDYFVRNIQSAIAHVRQDTWRVVFLQPMLLLAHICWYSFLYLIGF